MSYTQVQTKLNQAITTNASGDYAVRTLIEGDQTLDSLTVTGTLTAAEIGGTIAPQTSSSVGSVATISDVQSAILYNRLGGKIFDKNLILRTGDSLAQAADATGYAYSDANSVAIDDVVLIRTDVTVNTLNVELRPSVGSASVSIQSADNYYAAGVTGVKNVLTTVFRIGSTSAIQTYAASGTGSATFNVLAINLTSLGTLTANHVIMLNSMAEVMGWTITGTLSTSTRWDAIATWMATSADRSEFFAIAIPSHVSSMEPAIAEMVANRGGNLALSQNLEDDGWTVSSSAINGATVFTPSGPSGNIRSPKIPVGGLAGTSVSFTYYINALESTQQAHVRIFTYDKAGNYISALQSGAFSASLGLRSELNKTIPVNTDYLVLSPIGQTSGLYVDIEQFQLNAGATASTYSEPLNSPITFGSRSANLLPDGDGEFGASKWTGAVLTGTDLIVSLAATPAVTEFTARKSGWHTIAVQNTTADAATVTGDLNSVTSSAVAGSATPPWSVASVELVKDVTYDFTVTASVNTTKIQAMILEGEYTQAQVTALDYVAYEPIDLLTCPNNAGTSTVTDEIYQSADGKIWHIPNVQRNAGYLGVGSPEINPTAVYEEPFTGGIDGWAFAGAGSATYATNNVDLVFGGEGDRFLKLILSPYLNKQLLTTADITNFTGSTSTVVCVVAGGSSEASSRATLSTDYINADGKFSVVLTPDADDVYVYFFAKNGNACTFTIDNIDVYAYNIQENLAPVPEDISEFCAGNLNQLAEVGQNHQISSDGLFVYTTHYLGLGASLENIKDTLAIKADRNELNDSHHLVITTVTTGMTAATPYFFAFDTIDGFPDSIEGAYPVLEVWDTDVDAVDYYDKGVMITPKNPAPAAGDVLLDTYIARSKPQKTLTVDFS